MSSRRRLQRSICSCKHLVAQRPGQAMRGAGPDQEAQRCQNVVRHSAQQRSTQCIRKAHSCSRSAQAGTVSDDRNALGLDIGQIRYKVQERPSHDLPNMMHTYEMRFLLDAGMIA